MKGVCYYCQQKFWPKLALGEIWGEGNPVIRSRDHIIPTSMGGINKGPNIVSACKRCNSHKGSLLLEEFLKTLLLAQKRGDRSKYDPMDLAIAIDQTKQLLEQIRPYRESLFKEGHYIPEQTQLKYETPPNEWPDSELPKTFDWNLSLQQIDKKYSPVIAKPKREHTGRWPQEKNYNRDINPKIYSLYEQSKQPKKETLQSFIKRLSKYEYVYKLLTDANPDLPRWLFENILQ